MLEQGQFYKGTRPNLTDMKFQVLGYGDPGWVFARETFFTDDGDGDLKGWINRNHFSGIRQITKNEAYPRKPA